MKVLRWFGWFKLLAFVIFLFTKEVLAYVGMHFSMVILFIPRDYLLSRALFICFCCFQGFSVETT